MPVGERRAWIESQPLPRNIADLIGQAADAAGDRLAWNFFESGEQITYRDLRRAVNGLAQGLNRIGVRKGTHVAVMMPNVAAMPLSWLALGTLGAVMVPVNVNYLERELAYVINDSDAEFMLLHRQCLAVLERCMASGEIRIDPSRIFVVDPPAGSAYRDWQTLAGEPCDSYAPPENIVFLANELGRGTADDQRSSRRLLYGTMVAFRCAGRDADDYGLSYNVSEGGLYVRSLAPPVEDTVWLELRPPRTERLVRLEARVCWRRGYGGSAMATVPPGFGLEISDGSRADREAWEAGYRSFAESVGA